MCGPMSQEHKRSLIVLRSVQACIPCILNSLRSKDFRNSLLVCIDDGCVITYLTQQGLSNLNLSKLITIYLHGIHQLIIFRTMHQMGGLNHQRLHSICSCTLQSLLNIIDFLSITGLHMIYDNLCGKCSSY